VLEDPGEQAGGGGLAVGTRDAQDPALVQHVASQPFGPRLVTAAAVEDRLDQRVATAHDVADDEHVWLEPELVRLVALDDVDAERCELRAHRRVDVAVGARDAMAGGARQCGDTAHEGPADAEDVQVHGQVAGPRSTPTR
jgi:hypothetical protein